MQIRLGISLLVLAAIGSGCGSDDGGDGGSGGTGGTSSQASSCAELAAIWCAKACDCTSGAECTLVRPGSTETHDSETMCVNFYSALGCQSAPTDAQWVSGCETALSSAACDADAGLAHPAACDW